MDSVSRLLRRAASPVLALVVWELASRLGLVSPVLVPAPSKIAATFLDLALDGSLFWNLGVSVLRVTAGALIGVMLGVGLALIAGLSRRGEDAIDPLLRMARTLPHLALVPLFILWFGIGETPKVALVALGCLFPIYLNLYAGIRNVDRKLVEAGQTLGLTRAEQIRHVILPGAMPSFLVGLRFALGIGWLSLVVGEQINASSGIGYLAMSARDFMRTDIIFVALILYALMGLFVDWLVRLLEAKLLAWRPVLLKD